MSKQVTYMKVHQDIFVPGLGGLGNTLPPGNKTLAMSMETTEHGVQVDAKGPHGTNHSVLIPYANIVLAVLAPEASKAAPKAK